MSCLRTEVAWFLAHMGMKFIFSRSINSDRMKYSINYLEKRNKAIYSHCGIINSALFEKASHPLAPAVSMATLSHMPLSFFPLLGCVLGILWRQKEHEGDVSKGTVGMQNKNSDFDTTCELLASLHQP